MEREQWINLINDPNKINELINEYIKYRELNQQEINMLQTQHPIVIKSNIINDIGADINLCILSDKQGNVIKIY